MADRSGYIGRAPGDSSVTIARQSYNVSGVTTDFTFASSYTPTLIDVFVNGVKLVNITDFAATDGNTFSLITAAQDGDVVEAVAYKAFNLTTVSNAAADFSVGGNLTVTGSATVGGVGVVTAGSDASGLTGIVTSLTAGSNISLSGSTGAVTITGLANTSHVRAETLVVTGVSTLGVTTGLTALGVSGNVHATNYFGSGSGLTGLNVPAGFNELDAALFN